MTFEDKCSHMGSIHFLSRSKNKSKIDMHRVEAGHNMVYGYMDIISTVVLLMFTRS